MAARSRGALPKGGRCVQQLLLLLLQGTTADTPLAEGSSHTSELQHRQPVAQNLLLLLLRRLPNAALLAAQQLGLTYKATM
jgi:hypothetical protein